MINHRTVIVFAPNGAEVAEIDVVDFERSSREKPFIWVAHGSKTGGIRVPASEVYPSVHDNYGDDLFLPAQYNAVMGDGLGGTPELRAALEPRGARTTAAAPIAAPIAGSTDPKIANRLETLRAQLASEIDLRRTLERRLAKLERLITTAKGD